MSRTVLLVVAAWCLLLQGCAATSSSLPGLPRLPWSSPEGTLLYVAPFHDLSPGMEVGGPLWREVQDELYRRAPRRFLVVFDEAALAVDAAVVALGDEPVSADKRDVVVVASVRVVDRHGRVVRDLGRLERRGRYEVHSEAGETAARRRAALVVARQTLAGAIAVALLDIP
jgi:hypothetical protein